MKVLFKAVMGLALLITSSYALAVDCNEGCQLSQVKAYFSALDKVAKKDSTVEDIDALLAITHDDVKYIHVEYDANFTKETWRTAFLRQLELGRYQDTDKDQIRVLNSISGKNHIAIEYSYGVIQEDGTWEKTNDYLALFGFTDGKLSLIRELW